MVQQKWVKIKLLFNSIWIKSVLLLSFILPISVGIQAQTHNELNDVVYFKKRKATVYEHFDVITKKTGYYFIYNSNLVDNQKPVKLSKRKMSVDKAINQILQNPNLGYRVINQHILIYSKSSNTLNQTKDDDKSDSLTYIVIKGRVIDGKTNKPLQFASVSAAEQQVGVITNRDGYYVLKLNKTDSVKKINFSHVGYKMQEVTLSNLTETTFDIFLQPHVISIQEVLVRYINPNNLLDKALSSRNDNYSSRSYNQQAFYREGTLKNDSIVNYTEAIFDIYKTPFYNVDSKDRVKLIKWRKLTSSSKKDTVDVKLKAGIRTVLELDIIKYLPDFLQLNSIHNYNYKYAGITLFSDQEVYALLFEPKAYTAETYYSGVIYIEPNKFAILGCKFEVEPTQLKKVQSQFLVKKKRRLDVKFDQITYQVNYSSIDSLLYVNHIRCDIKLNTRLKNSFSKSKFHTFIEFAGLSLSTNNIKKHKYSESIKQNSIFADKVYQYDDQFWGEFNYIPPEQSLTDVMTNLKKEIKTLDK